MSSGQTAPAQERVLVLDFGSQYSRLIARRVRENQVYCDLVRHDLPADRIRALAPRGLILSGGPASVYEPAAPQCDPELFHLGIPVLGICYGMQLIGRAFGGKVAPAPQREYGRANLSIATGSTDLNNQHLTNGMVDATASLFAGLESPQTVWMSHGDQVVELPTTAFQILASTPTCPLAAVRHRELPLFGLQFHPEVSHTVHGTQLLRNFLLQICGCRGDWQMQSFLEFTVDQVRQRVGSQRVLCGLSGGVDSAVTAALLQRAIGTQLTCIFVDNGLLRTGEREMVEQTFREHFRMDLRSIDASALFLDRLQNVAEPQRKREIIGHTFIDVFKAEAQTLQREFPEQGDTIQFLAQGTLYPDVIESGSNPDGPAINIKTHHNVGGLPSELGFELIEPLRDLFKDEVRELGKVLGLPDEMIWRHPFPGPGLAVRCLGEITVAKLRPLRAADTIFITELKQAGLYRDIAQAFAVLLPVQSVGVMGDGRTYEQVIALRAVQSVDFMTADWVPLPPEFLGRVATRIINEVPGINRVVYDISTKPPATIEWE